MLPKVMDNKFYYNPDNRNMLRKVTVKIRLEVIDTQEGVIVEALLDSGVIELIISLEFAKKQEFKLKKIERLIYMRNVDSSFNKKESICQICEKETLFYFYFYFYFIFIFIFLFL